MQQNYLKCTLLQNVKGSLKARKTPIKETLKPQF